MIASAPLAGPIERICVFRALMLGDLMCAVPALRALRQGFPAARLTLVGLPWAQELAARLDCVDEFIAVPGWPGLPETAADVRALPDFLARMQAERFDLAVQLHGSGPIVNPLVACFGARQTAGFRIDGAWYPEAEAARYAAWPTQGHEIERLLALTDRLGLPRCGTRLDFPLADDDRSALAAIWPGMRRAPPYVCVHAGSQLSSRRWPVERFAAVADELAGQGLNVVLTGGAQEVPLAAELAARMRAGATNLAGRTDLWTLGALIEGAELVLCNDTGVSHIAAALGCPSVVVSCGADVARWAPLDGALHAVLWQPMACRPCSHAVCPFEHGCATAVTPASVIAALDRVLPHRGESLGGYR